MVDEIVTVLNDWNWAAIVIGIFVGLTAAKGGIGLLAWFFDFFGIETKWMRKRKEQAELLKNTADAVKKLAEETKGIKAEHAKDKADVVNQNLELKNILTGFMDEMRQSISENHKEIQLFYDRQLEFKGESVERENRINDRIDTISEKDIQRDTLIEDVRDGLRELKGLFINKEIEDMRWTILDFTTSLSEGKKYNREAFDHVIRIYHEYERILKENDMENGLVDESAKFIQEKYRERLKTGFN